MTEISMPWGGLSIGDHGRYSDDQWSDMYRKLFQVDRTLDGVVSGYANELLVAAGAGASVDVATGAALVDGKFYENDAVVNVSVAGGDGFYNIVLRKDYIAQTVRLAAVGPGGAIPAVTQTDGTVWEVSIATVSVAASVPTVTDNRYYVMTSSGKKIMTIHPTIAWNDTDSIQIAPSLDYAWPLITAKKEYLYSTIFVPNDYHKNGVLSMISETFPDSGKFYYCYNYAETRRLSAGTFVSKDSWGGSLAQLAASANAIRLQLALTLTGDIRPGDMLRMIVKRDGTHLSDTTTSILNVLGWQLAYE